ncbi:MAG TPA: class I SAM-dependent methyltransferase [Polyangiaceae bacterium]|jgi:precorrin-6B methylase 2|nr:class I SAM-dependent methyltransferase [Polyangiaceae bacterium]
MSPRLNLTAHELAGVVGAAAAAANAGLWPLLAQEAHSEAQLASSTSVDPLALSRVLGVLVAAGIVERDPLGRVKLAGHLADECAATPGGSAALIRLFAGTPGFLRHAERSGHMDGDGQTRASAYAPTVGGLGRLFGSAAEQLARELPVVDEILDVGAGSGIWSLSMAQVSDHTQVTGLDLPKVLDVFRGNAEKYGLYQRTRVLACDYHELELSPAAYDRIVLANVLHLESAAAARQLILRVVPALKAGGQIVVVDVFDSGADAALGHAVYQLHLAMRTQSGFAHARREIESWLESAGSCTTEFFPLEGYVRGLGALCANYR